MENRSSSSGRRLRSSHGSSEPDRSYYHSSARRGRCEEQGYATSCESVNEFVEGICYNSSDPPRLRLQSATHSSPESTPDRISALPDSVLLHILSFLSMEDVVMTTTLSKRWAYLWTSVPCLVFRHRGSWDDGIREFVSFVNRTLALYGCSIIRKFHIEFEYQKCFDSRVNLWVRFATRKNVEELGLYFYGEHDLYHLGFEHYTLPQYLYTNSSLKRLNLRFCHIIPNGLIKWRSLKNLSISFAELGDDLIQNILTGSPVLEYLELYKCHGFNRLDITSASLRKLVINCYTNPLDLEEDSGLEISAPKLQSLGILGYLHGKKCRVKNLSSLAVADLNFMLSTELEDSLDDYEAYRNMLTEILENLRQVEELTIGSWCIKVLSICEIKALPSPLSKRKCLKLDACLSKWDLPGIVSLLESSPDLETLVINMNSCDRAVYFEPDFYNVHNFAEDQYWTSQKGNLKCLLLHLKTVKIVGFIAEGIGAGGIGNKLEIAFMQFLLKNARMLEKMVIHSEAYNLNRWRIHAAGPHDLLEVAKRLLSFPRSSSHAEIVLKDCSN